MAWTAKPSSPGSLNTGHSLYSACVAYAPFLEQSGTTVTEKIGPASFTFTNLTWTDSGTNPPGYGVSGGTQVSEELPDTFNPIGGLSACSGVCWLHSGTISTITAESIVGFARWGGGPTNLLCRLTGSGSAYWRVIVGLSTTSPDTGDILHGMSNDTDYTLIWTYTGGTVTLYRDMNSLGTGTGGSGTKVAVDAGNGFDLINGQASHAPFAGTNAYIYGAALFNVALSEEQRQVLVDEGPAFLYGAAAATETLNVSLGEPILWSGTF